MMPAIGWLFHGDPETYLYIPESLERYPAQRGVEKLMHASGLRAGSATKTASSEPWGSTSADPFPGRAAAGLVLDSPVLMAHQYIYSMVNLRKVVPPQREILKGIYLSFLPGAKIGVLGFNGAGKSTLLKIMAGVDKDFAGEAFAGGGHADRVPAAGAAARYRRRTCAATSRKASRRRAACSSGSRS